MNRAAVLDDGLRRAYKLAYFIHRDKELAVRIVKGALANVELVVAKQDKRLYYAPRGRSLSDRSKVDRLRTKVRMSELHLVQRLTYVMSEPYERRQEQPDDATVLD